MRHFHPGRFHSDPRLVTLVRDLSLIHSISEITEIITHAARLMIAADGITFVLRDEDCCYYADEDAISPLWKGQRFPAKACISGWCMIRETVILEDIRADPRIPADAYRPTFMQSLAMVPVRREQPIAAIGAYWRRRHRATDEEVALLQAIADAASLAISHAELQETQAELRAAKERAERSEREKSNFLAAVSHDLRQPLQAMAIFLSILQDRADGETHRVLGLLGGALESCNRLTGSVSEFARLAVLTAHPRPFPLRPLLDQIAAETAATAAADGSEFRSVATSRYVVADPELVARIVRNLLSNALKFAKGRRVLLGCRRQGDHAGIEVWDSGPGIAPSEIDRIFEDFYRSEASTVDNIPGLGLGLPTVRRLAAATGGAVSVRSWPGRGSVFTLRLPLAPRRLPN